MINQEELQSYLNDYLACEKFVDYAPNGLQIEGRTAIKRIATAVTASYEAILEAISLKVDALLVHHGYFWRQEEATITGIKRRRIGELISHNINLFAYHLPLDCHPEIGNNILFGQLFGVTGNKGHLANKIPDLLMTGTLPKPLQSEALYNIILEKLDRAPIHVACHHKPIHRIAWCTGAAQDLIEQAFDLGVDAYLSGEISERTYYQAKELGIHYFACGHHATERYGIQALGEHLSQQFSLEHHFIDSLNPV